MREGWEMKKLGDIGKVSMCKRILKEQTLPVGDIPFYKIGTFGKTPNAFISKEIYNEFIEKYPFPKKGDILISASGTIGRCVIYDGEPAYFQDSNIVWIANDQKKVSNSFLYLFYSYCDWNPSKGATISRLYNDDLRKIPIPVPPLPEQQRIVAYLDATFASLNQAKANLQKNLQNAKELFETELRNVFENKGVGWEDKSLKEVTSKIGSGATPRGGNENYKSEGISLIRSMNVHDEGFKEKNLAFIDDLQAKELNNVTIQENDILLNITGASVARCCIVPKEFLPARVNQHVSIIRIKDNLIDTSFLHFALTSNYYKQILLGIGEQGATRQAITKVQLENFILLFPKSLQTQQAIVSKLDALKTQTQALENLYQTKLNNIEELRSGILKRAFEG